MSARLTAALVALVLIGIGTWRVIIWRSRPPEVMFTRAVRETITSSVSTNGKVEPIESGAARAESSGAVTQIRVRLGQNVTREQVLIELDSTQARSEVEAAQARIAAAQAELALLKQGGRSADIAAIRGEIENAQQELRVAERDYTSKLNLQAKQAATKTEVEAAKDRVDLLKTQIASLEQRRSALVSPPDRSSAEARLHEAEAALQQAQDRIRMSAVRAPIAGTVYQFDLKPGAYLNAGDFVAGIGRLDEVKVTVYVDEPDLGRVAKGKPVTITWDALPGRQWKGVVDRMPSQIVTLGSRQVGEVVCVIQNPNHELLPGTNVTVLILSETAEDAITIPKEAIQRQKDQLGVFVLNGDHLEWRAITQGVNNPTRTQVSQLREGEAVAIPGDKQLAAGIQVRPIFQ